MTALAILGILALLFLAFVLWLRAKVRRGVAWVKVTLLKTGVDELRQKHNKPGEEVDPKIADLITRGEAALVKAEAAFADGDTRGVSAAADGVIKELLELVAAQAKKEVDAEEKARLADRNKLVIDVTATTTETAPPTSPATLALPAPDDKPKDEPK